MKFVPGFTLVEVLVVIAVMLILLSGVAVSASGYFSSGMVRQQVLIVADMLEQARARSMNGAQDDVWGAHLGVINVTLYKGSVYDGSSSGHQVYAFQKGVVISNVSLNGGGDDVVFTRVNGSTDDYGSFSVGSADGVSRYQISVNREGLVEVTQ